MMTCCPPVTVGDHQAELIAAARLEYEAGDIGAAAAVDATYLAVVQHSAEIRQALADLHQSTTPNPKGPAMSLDPSSLLKAFLWLALFGGVTLLAMGAVGRVGRTAAGKL